ncbi:MAG: mechanosensitive ion channel [Pirellulaceae bacterium]|nr:mechanosensitive ion channel [Pirellulaceae bacterium]
MLKIVATVLGCIHIAVMLSTFVVGQEQAPASTTQAPEKKIAETNPLTVEGIQASIKQLQADPTLADPQKQALLPLYDSMIVELKKKLEDERQAKEFAANAEAAPGVTSDIKRRKEIPPAREWVSDRSLRSYELQPLQELLQTQKSNLQAAIDARTKTESSISTREVAKKDLPRRIADEKARLLELNEKLAASASAVTAEPKDIRLREVDKQFLQIQIDAAAEKIRKREQELRLYEAEAELLPLRKDLYLADERHYQSVVNEINDELNKRREIKIEEDKKKAESLAASAPAKLKTSSDRLVKRANDWLELAKRNTSIKLDMEQSISKYKALEERFKIMTERSQSNREQAFGGINSWNGLLLRRHRTELPDDGKLKAQLNDHLDLMQQTETLIIELEDWKSQNSIEQLDAMGHVDISDPEAEFYSTPGLLQYADQLLSAERELVDSYILDAKNFSDNLNALSESKQSTIRLADRYRGFIDQHILWIRSAKPISMVDVEQLWPSVQFFFDFAKWRNTGLDLVASIQRKLWQPVLFCLFWGLLVFNHSKLRRTMTLFGEQANRSTMTNFSPTLKSVFLCLLLSAPWPALMLFIGFGLQHADAPQSFTASLGLGLMVAARYFFPLEVIRQVCRTGGLADKHFGWPRSTASLIRGNLRWLIDLGVPSAAVCAMLFNFGENRYEHSLGRLCFAVLMLLCSLFMFTVLRPSRGVFTQYLANNPGGWADRLRYVWIFGFTAGPLLLCFNSLSGYHYTALRLSMLWHTTIMTMIGLFLLFELVKRWALLSRRRIMTEQARQRLEEAQQRDVSMPLVGNTIANSIMSVETGDRERIRIDNSVDLAEINVQTLRLSVSVLVVIAFLAVAYIWSGVLPAVNVLDSVTLWTVDGATPNEKTPFTLANLVWAIPIVVLTFVGARNLPGLLEIALLQQLPFQDSVRYAISTLSRYAIVMLGIVLTFNSIGVRWASIQWLVAALGVGLGFGLQEIFANFVSGLILLFEQPIRVGDVITMGETTGTVSRIRMRATTITNWDRQELVVPNKDLITGRLLNWTLTDSTNRLILTVGIAYKSDPEVACSIIQKICKEHPNVMTDPAPVAHFDAFADSTINIKARIFLDKLETRIQNRHDLYVQIHRQFTEAGIEIAFPQRDLHVRSLPEALSASLLNRPQRDS